MHEYYICFFLHTVQLLVQVLSFLFFRFTSTLSNYTFSILPFLNLFAFPSHISPAIPTLCLHDQYACFIPNFVFNVPLSIYLSLKLIMTFNLVKSCIIGQPFFNQGNSNGLMYRIYNLGPMTLEGMKFGQIVAASVLLVAAVLLM